MRKHVVHTAIEVTWQTNDFNCLSAVIFFFRQKGMVCIMWAKSPEKWICLLDTLQLFVHVEAKTGRCYLYQSHTRKDLRCFAPINYFVFFKRRHVVRIFIESRLPMNNSTFVVSLIFKNQGICTEFVSVSKIISQLDNTEWLSSVMVFLGRKREKVFTVIDVTWPMNFSIWLFSIIFSFQGMDSNFLRRSTSHGKPLLQSGFHYLFYYFHANIRSSYYDPSGMTNEWF
jgi:hypothetical protein